MKLIDALATLRYPVPDDAPRLSVSLVCGFTPLHLQTFLEAELRQALPASRVEVSSGVFDDLLGNLRRADASADAVAVVLEWADVDARLGLRRLGGWRSSDLSDIVEVAQRYLTQLGEEMTRAAELQPVICCLPTLPLPPLFPEGPDQSGSHELSLRADMAAFGTLVGQHSRIRVCSAQRLDAASPTSARRDLKSEFATGFPYSLPHASAVAEGIAALIETPVAKKGLITDLDDTLWGGILGDVGVANVSWDLDSHTQRHALYQQFLGSLASAGVLIAVASRNDPNLVAEAFERPDLILSKEAVFPFAVHWGRKSASVQSILDAWNIASDAVVIVDDSQAEIAEVQHTFPELIGVPFPAASDPDLWSFFLRLRALFAKTQVTQEDTLRTASLRSAGQFRDLAEAPESSADDFLASAAGRLEFSLDPSDSARALDLLNKTNQFNLNGRRMTEAVFMATLRDPAVSLITASYADKFGPLGTVAVLLLRSTPQGVAIEAWVMSCRALSRRIEHHCLRYVYDKFHLGEVSVAYSATDRNGLVLEFLTSLTSTIPTGQVRLTSDALEKRGPLLVHRVSESDQ